MGAKPLRIRFNKIDAILNVKGFYYCCIIRLISKNEAINLMQNADLTEKAKHYVKMGSPNFNV